MENVIEIHQKKFFTLDEAKKILPIVRRITDGAFQQVKLLSTQLSYISDQSKRTEVEERVRETFQEWYEKIRKLGCESKGLWLVDFDNGEGYYCWHYPEEAIEFYHGYFEGYQGRVKIH